MSKRILNNIKPYNNSGANEDEEKEARDDVDDIHVHVHVQDGDGDVLLVEEQQQQQQQQQQRQQPLLLHASLLHLGKAGGGSVLDRVEELGYQFRYREYHRGPPPHHKYYDNSTHSKTPEILFVMTLRDPVERFQSNFNFIRLASCNHNTDTRIHNGKSCPKFWQNLDTCCKVHKQQNKREFNAGQYWDRYNSDANNLAEAFCNTNENTNTNTNENAIISQTQAKQDLERLVHSRLSIHNWLFDDDNNKPRNKNKNSMDWMDKKLIGIVVEKGYDFIDQIDSALIWILSTTKYNTAAADAATTIPADNYNETLAAAAAFETASREFNQRKEEWILQQQQQQLAPTNSTDDATSIDNNNNTDNKRRHSSTSAQHFPWIPTIDQRISSKGVCCLMKYYYYDDYTLLADPIFIETVCKGRSLCIDSIKSINQRRNEILQHINTGGDCRSNLVLSYDNNNDTPHQTTKTKTTLSSQTILLMQSPLHYSIGFPTTAIIVIFLMIIAVICLHKRQRRRQRTTTQIFSKKNEEDEKTNSQQH